MHRIIIIIFKMFTAAGIILWQLQIINYFNHIQQFILIYFGDISIVKMTETTYKNDSLPFTQPLTMWCANFFNLFTSINLEKILLNLLNRIISVYKLYQAYGNWSITFYFLFFFVYLYEILPYGHIAHIADKQHTKELKRIFSNNSFVSFKKNFSICTHPYLAK